MKLLMQFIFLCSALFLSSCSNEQNGERVLSAKAFSEKINETVTNTPSSKGMSLDDYKKLLDTDKLVLVDFYAEWCGPCKKMEPFLKEIAEEKSATVKLIRINIDENMELEKALKVEALPTLKLYKSQTIVWDNLGFVTKEEILKHL